MSKVMSVRSLHLGTPKMIEKGIMARVEINIHLPDDKGILYSVGNILVRKRKDTGDLWVAMPSEKFIAQTDNGEETRWKTIVKVGPDEGKQGGDTATPIQDTHMNHILDKYREALAAAKQGQTAQATEPAVAPADKGEAAF